METWFFRDNKKRFLFITGEKKRSILKMLATSKKIKFLLRWKAQLKLREMQKDSSAVRLKNRCLQSGRSRSTFKKYKLSRIKLRELALLGYLPGFKKASW